MKNMNVKEEVVQQKIPSSNNMKIELYETTKLKIVLNQKLWSTQEILSLSFDDEIEEDE